MNGKPRVWRRVPDPHLDYVLCGAPAWVTSLPETDTLFYSRSWEQAMHIAGQDVRPRPRPLEVIRV